MKIKKEFIPLILSGEKKYEYRNSSDKEGFYKIGNKLYKLVLQRNYPTLLIDLRKTKEWVKNKNLEQCTTYTFCSGKITEQEYEWINENFEYFKEEVFIYQWVELRDYDIIPKELEAV